MLSDRGLRACEEKASRPNFSTTLWRRTIVGCKSTEKRRLKTLLSQSKGDRFRARTTGIGAGGREGFNDNFSDNIVVDK
jgi:hypothetical protein